MKRRSFLGAIAALCGGVVAAPAQAVKNSWAVYFGPDRGFRSFTDEQLRELGWATLSSRAMTDLWAEYERAPENHAAIEAAYDEGRFDANPYFEVANKASTREWLLLRELIGRNG